MKKYLFHTLLTITIITGGLYLMQQYPHQPAPSLDQRQFILFDFDGTLADSLDTAIAFFNSLRADIGNSAVQPLPKEQLRMKSAQEILQHYQIPWYQLPFVHKRALSFLEKTLPNHQLFPGIKEALLQLKAQGFRLGILTSNSETLVRHFLNKHDMNLFEVIYSNSSIFGKHVVLNRFLKDYNLTSDHVIYVGDEIRDIQASHKAGIKIIAVSWGYNDAAVLTPHKPYALARTPQDLLTLSKQLRIAQNTKHIATVSL